MLDWNGLELLNEQLLHVTAFGRLSQAKLEWYGICLGGDRA